jgi:hypothetical protein
MEKTKSDFLDLTLTNQEKKVECKTPRNSPVHYTYAVRQRASDTPL